MWHAAAELQSWAFVADAAAAAAAAGAADVADSAEDDVALAAAVAQVYACAARCLLSQLSWHRHTHQQSTLICPRSCPHCQPQQHPR